MLTSRNQRIFKLISSAEFLEVHQNIQNWFRFLFYFFISVDFDSDLRKKLTFIAGKLRGRSYLHLSFSNKKVPTHVRQELSSLFFVFLVACLIRLVENSCNEFYN